MEANQRQESWDIVVSPKSGLSLNLGELWKYKDLILLFVKRDFISIYKQTILGPLWYVIQPVVTTVAFTLIFGRIANIPTEDLPGPLFYMIGLSIWNLFSACITKSSTVFVSNASVFGKVYFPRLTVPVANTISNFISFSIQFIIMFCFWLYYKNTGQYSIQYKHLLALPFLLLITAMLGTSIGIVISALTTKYRDFSFLLGFAIQLFMYMSPIIYSKGYVTGKMKLLMQINPVSDFIEYYRFIFTGVGFNNISFETLLIKAGFTILLFLFSVLIFNRTERSFMDTV